jgi:hypothetical protein
MILTLRGGKRTNLNFHVLNVVRTCWYLGAGVRGQYLNLVRVIWWEKSKIEGLILLLAATHNKQNHSTLKPPQNCIYTSLTGVTVKFEKLNVFSCTENSIEYHYTLLFILAA